MNFQYNESAIHPSFIQHINTMLVKTKTIAIP